MLLTLLGGVGSAFVLNERQGADLEEQRLATAAALPGSASLEPRPALSVLSEPVAAPPPEPPPAPPAPGQPAPEPLAPEGPPQSLRGLSGWIDVFDYSDAQGPIAAMELVDRAAAQGAQVLWVQTSRYNTADIASPEALGALLDRAAVRNLPVVAWVLPEFADPAADARRALAAAEFRSPGGAGVDAVGLDIEVRTVPVEQRTPNLLGYTRTVRASLDIPLYGIVLPPSLLARSSTWWPGFPWVELATEFDGLVTMGYWSGSIGGEPYAYTRETIDDVRRLVGDPAYPLHVIGGLAEDTGTADTEAFCRAAAEGGAVGAGLYDVMTTRLEAVSPLGACRAAG